MLRTTSTKYPPGHQTCPRTQGIRDMTRPALLRRLRGLWGRRDRGSATLELAILTPFMLMVIALMVLGGRVAVAGNPVTTGAGNAAREASLARTAGTAVANATSSARAGLAAQAINCEGGGTVSVDTSGFGAAARGVPGQVVTVTGGAGRLMRKAWLATMPCTNADTL